MSDPSKHKYDTSEYVILSNSQTGTNYIELIRAYVEGYRGSRDVPVFDLCVDTEVNKRITELTAENARLTAQIAAADGLREAVALISKMETTHGDWDEGCFYFNNTAAPEMQDPLVKCREAATAYDNAKKG